MKVALDPHQAKDWFGGAPPDLSVIARSRADMAKGTGADYLYTYLRTYYRDDTKADRLEQPGVPERRHAARAVAAAGPARGEVVEAEGRARPAKTTHVFAGFEQITPGTLTQQEYDDAVADLVLHAVDGRAGAGPARAPRRLGAAVPGPAHADRLAPERGVLERRQVAHLTAAPGDAARLAHRRSAASTSPAVRPLRFADLPSPRSPAHDGALLRNDLPLFAPLPLRAVREGHGLRDPRRRPVRQARGHRADEPVQRGADPGRARPHPVRVAHHQRVHRRALPAPAADAGRPGGARARAAVPAQLREGAVRARQRARGRAASRPTTSSSRRRARRSATA